MKNTLSKVLIFVAGAAVGSVATWKVVETQYRKLAKQEAEEIREYYCGKYGEPVEKDSDEDGETEDEAEPEPELEKKPDLREYAAVVLGEGYTNYAKGGVHETRTKEVDEVARPYVIPPEEFDEAGYRTVSLTYYEDNVLVDMQGKVIKNVDDVVGIESLDHFGEYEDDSVFVRNDAKKTDYEILRDPRKYSVIAKTTAHSAEDE